MERSELAVQTFERDFSCSQSVLSAFVGGTDLSRETALRVASGFGGGIARSGEICGAVAGAVMALGLRHCGHPTEDPQAKVNAYPPIREFLARFRERHGTILCRELLGCDISTPEGLQRAQETGLIKTRCPGFVRDAAEIVESLL